MSASEMTTANLTNSTTDAITTSPLYVICPPVVPNSSYYLHEISKSKEKTALFAFFGLLCGLTLLIYLFEIVSILQNQMHIMRRIRMVMLLSLYPVFSSLALLAVVVPRAAPLLDLVTNVYFAITLWHFIQLMLMYYGGEKKMIEDFGQSMVSITVPPICCVFFCLPKFKMNKKFLVTLKLGATQFLIFRPILLVISMILWVEDRYEYVDETTGRMQPFKSASTYIALVNMGTTLLAMWPLIIIFRASLQRLRHFHIRGKFIVFQLVMICGSLQDAILTQVANFNFLKCTQYLPVKSWALEIHHLAIIGEMFILSVAALAVYWKYIRENIPLDFHHPSNTLSHANSGDFDTPDIINSSDDVVGYACLSGNSDGEGVLSRENEFGHDDEI